MRERGGAEEASLRVWGWGRSVLKAAEQDSQMQQPFFATVSGIV